MKIFIIRKQIWNQFRNEKLKQVYKNIKPNIISIILPIDIC